MKDNEKEPSPASSHQIPGCPSKHVEITALGELHTLEFALDITADWDSYQASLGRCNFVADHALDSVPEGVTLPK